MPNTPKSKADNNDLYLFQNQQPTISIVLNGPEEAYGSNERRNDSSAVYNDEHVHS